jgi:Tol biopolymer transport system component
MHPDGHGLRRVLDTPVDEWSVAWSPNGSWLAVVSGGQLYNSKLLCVRWNGSNPRTLAQLYDLLVPVSWSADGQWLLYEDYRNRYQIHRLRVADGLVEVVNFAIGDKGGLQASPDGAWVAFAAYEYRENAGVVYRMRPAGSQPERIFEVTGGVGNLRWSPDGAWLALATRADGVSTLWRMRADGTSRLRLAEGDSPDWSPDGRWLVFVQTNDATAQLYRIRPDGSGLQQITGDPLLKSSPAWSPDGAWIAYVGSTVNQRNLYRIRPDGSERQQLTGGSGEDIWPDWSPLINLPWQPGLLLGVSLVMIVGPLAPRLLRR